MASCPLLIQTLSGAEAHSINMLSHQHFAVKSLDSPAVTPSHAVVGEKAWEQREDVVARGLHVSGLWREADVLATLSAVVRQKLQRGRAAGRCIMDHVEDTAAKKGVKITCGGGEKKPQVVSNSSEGLLPQLEINTRQ